MIRLRVMAVAADWCQAASGRTPFVTDACALLRSRLPAVAETAPPRVRVRPQERHSTAARVRQRPDDYQGRPCHTAGVPWLPRIAPVRAPTRSGVVFRQTDILHLSAALATESGRCLHDC